MGKSSKDPTEVQSRPAQAGRQLILRRGDSIHPVPVRWLWQGWLACGKLHIVAGPPGCGKTGIAIALAAFITAGGTWPDGSRAPLGNVVMWSGEDNPDDVLIPRLLASGGDPARIHIVGGVSGADGGVSPFDPARDVSLLSDAMCAIPDVRLLIVDPIVSAISGDSHKNAETRRGLQPLVDMAESHQSALLGITHFTKGTAGQDPVDRVTGSIAFGAMARIVTIAAKLPADGTGSERRVFMRAKSNIGPDNAGFAYEVVQEELQRYPGVVPSAVRWGDAVEGTARDLLAQAEPPIDDDRAGPQGAAEWLRALLRSGSKAVADVQAAASDAGWAWRTVQRAMSRAGVISRRDGFGGSAIWSIGATPAPLPPLPERGADGATGAGDSDS